MSNILGVTHIECGLGLEFILSVAEVVVAIYFGHFESLNDQNK